MIVTVLEAPLVAMVTALPLTAPEIVTGVESISEMAPPEDSVPNTPMVLPWPRPTGW